MRRRRRKQPGAAPGTLVHTGEVRTDRVRIRMINYNEAHLAEQDLSSVAEVPDLTGTGTITWINVDGLHEEQVIEAFGSEVGLHPLAMEDVLSVGQRPKVDDYGNLAFFVLRMVRFDEAEGALRDEQVSLAVGPGFVLSFQEQPGDVFEPVRDRLRSSRGRIRSMGADYLAYALLDAVVDHYFIVLETLSETIEDLSDEIVAEPTTASLQRVHDLKRSLLDLRRSVWPLREVAAKVIRAEAGVFQDETLVYVRDVYDHAVQVIDTVESLRDIVAGMHDLYLSSLSQRMNEIMKVLTIIATIFIPLTFIAGIYGMNFEYMPELGWRWSYFVVLGLMAAIAVGMLVAFRRRGWL